MVVMEARGGAHHQGRPIIAMSHECRLIPPVYVKPFAGRLQADQNDAAAIALPAPRRAMRFEMFPDLIAIDDRAGLHADLAGPGKMPGRDPIPDRHRFGLGGGE